MPGTTLNGLPYPKSSDPISEGAAAVQALAEAVDARTQGGRVTLANIPAGTAWTDAATITFETQFPNSSLAISLQNASSYGGSDLLELTTNAVSRTGFVIRARCATARTGVAVFWIAVPATQ